MKNQTIAYIVILLIVLYSSFSYAGIIVVTNTNDSGTGVQHDKERVMFLLS